MSGTSSPGSAWWDIRVPRVTPGGTEFTVFNRYEHRRRDVDAALGRLFLSGVSTRKLKTIARELFGKEVSAQTVSNALASLDQELAGYRTKPLEGYDLRIGGHEWSITGMAISL
jgi:putative transposase